MESIKETLARNPLAPSTTSREIEKTCRCGAQFLDKVFTRQNGEEFNLYNSCPDCRKKAEIEQQREEAEVKLKEALKHVNWHDVARVPSSFIQKSFTNFNKQLQPKAFNAVFNLQWKSDLNSIPQSLVLLSPGLYGVGKTHLVCALINKIIEESEKAVLGKDLFVRFRRCPVVFTSENGLLRRIRETYNKRRSEDEYVETEADIYESLKLFDLLVIDDVGKVRPRDLNFLQGVYFNIIDQRYTDQQALILTTNHDLNELEEHIGGACADRIRDMAGKDGFIVMKGQSYRRSKG